MKATSFSNIGTRENNEDSLGYTKTAFVVCDGMGGHTSGEIASKFVVEGVLQLVGEKQSNITKETIEDVLETVQLKLNKKLEAQPELLKMGTTFTGAFLTNNSVFVAHIGDSRVYVIKPSEQKIWHTWDHSLVGGLMQSKEITREKGRLHPMANRISKAITANEDNKTVTASIIQFNNLQKGDLIFLCSDGVNEAWKEHELMELLCDTQITVNEKLNRIETQCRAESRDNNTAILIEIEKEDAFNNRANDEVDWITLQDFKEDYAAFLENEKKEEDEEELMIEVEEPSNKRTTKNSFLSKKRIIVVVILILLILFFILKKS